MRSRVIISLIASLYFLSPFIAASMATVPLVYTYDEFEDAYNQGLAKLDLSFKLHNVNKEKETITSNITKDITLVENIDDLGAIHELVMIGQGNGMDIVLAMALLIGVTNPELSKEEIGNGLEELRLFDESYKFKKNETTVELDTIRYNLKYSQESGVIFTVSKIQN
ncbi:hypothetical protein [Bacillus pinisoli]|uniref:hypothetical protein n=1 Tax=Bacillus pinisoli TaxID=2901866 RepID=UPI001FF44A30|nr:hypothetical protein [Bacillus pinisoli]